MDEAERRAYYLDRYYRNRSAAIARLGGECVDCGATEDLQFDHVDRTAKQHDVSQLMNGYRRELLEAELAKCVLRCGPCHERKTVEYRDDRSVPHGGGVSGKKNCKCDLCRTKKREYMRSWKQARRASGGDS